MDSTAVHNKNRQENNQGVYQLNPEILPSSTAATFPVVAFCLGVENGPRGFDRLSFLALF